VPRQLLDRMEIIRLSGYSEEEKMQIARRYLLPRQLAETGLTTEQLTIPDGTLRRIVSRYTREAGVRDLERSLGKVARKIARRVAEGEKGTTIVKRSDIARYLGPTKFSYGSAEERDEVGVATGVAWTQFGGDVLSVEVNTMEGRPELILTGQLGEVMQESARAALSYTRSRANELGIKPGFFENHAIHIHVPAGAVPKDGPSAGITLTTALVSALTGKPVRRDVAMTGEVTLRGRVLPIGGLKEKILAAHRAGIKNFILPAKNRKDIEEVPAGVLRSVKLHFVDHVDEVLKLALIEQGESQIQAVA
jgi:ATP-dependent Lon protease